MRTTFIAFLLGALSAAHAAGFADDWPRYAHDKELTSRSPLKGKIVVPETAWSYALGGAEWEVEIVPTPGKHDLALNSAALLPVASRTLVPPGPLLLDLDGTGALRRAQESYHERWARILPGVKGWQRVAWSHTWTDQKVCRLQLYAYDQGFNQPRLVWQSDPPEDTIFQPLDLVADIDGDGVPEICVAAHYRVMIFEGATGRKETELRYHQSRPYGWFGLADVDGDGQVEFVTIGDFQSHIDVLNYDPKKPEPERLSVRWRRDIETNIEERRKWPQVGPRPLVDVTGDGRPELVLNLFNDTGDGQWHAVVLNAATGAVLEDFPQRFVQGSADVEANGKEALFLTATDGVLVPAFGLIELISLAGGKASVLWSRASAAWASADLPRFGAAWSTTSSQGMRQVIVSASPRGRRPAFFVAHRAAISEPPFQTTLEAMTLGANHRVESLWKLSGLTGNPDFTGFSSNTPSLSVRLQVPDKTVLALSGQEAEARLVQTGAVRGTLSTPIAARLQSNGAMAVVVEGPAQEILALAPPSRGSTNARVIWRRPGRGMSDGSRFLGLLAADLAGDGRNEIIAADQDGTGRARLVAYRHDGSIFWQTTFGQTPGAAPVWNVGALTFWWPGHFRARNQTDLFVNTRRGLMHSDVGQLLDGRTGKLVWQQEKAVVSGQFAWGYAGIPPGIADLNGDGLDELVSLYPVCFWVADGRTGAITGGVELASRKNLPAWAAYGEPIIHSFARANEPAVLLDSPYILALLMTNGIPLWHGLARADYPTGKSEDNSGQTTAVRHALLDVDGDGVFEIASAGYQDGVRVIDSRDGRILWHLAAPAPTCHRVVAVDIDGRKGDELLYVSDKTLVAITGDRGSGRVLWTWQGPASLAMPAIADLDGDGSAEILVQAADGTIYCIHGR